MRIDKNARIVFLGDSITEGYGVGEGECWIDFLPGDKINRGISGDTTAGMLRRFSAHVLRQKPDYAVIMGGINDLSEGADVESVCMNLQQMYERAAMYGITVIPAVCVMPDYDMVLDNDWAAFYPGIRFLSERLERLAEWIRAYAKENELFCLDFARFFPDYTSDGYCRYFSDGVHPNERGHAIMADIARRELFDMA